MPFHAFGLSKEILDDLHEVGYHAPTPIQEKAIPVILKGKDVIGCAQTGTGKTGAFAIPIIEQLAQAKRTRQYVGPRCLILAPTRELVLQTREWFDRLSKRHRLNAVTIIGGADMRAQHRGLRERPDAIIATPGRLVDHLQQRTVNLRAVEILVLDEADRMLDMGFAPQLNVILAAVPTKRQTLLFSATMPRDLDALSRAALKDPERIEVGGNAQPIEKIMQRFYHVDQYQKTVLLLALLRTMPGSTLVFTRTKHRADKLALELETSGFAVGRLHANRTLAQRTAALNAFKQGRIRVLAATDIAARGIDVADITHVVNYDLPHVPEDYVHRIGRTARAGAGGSSSSFISPDEVKQARDIQRLLHVQINLTKLPEGMPAPAARSATGVQPRGGFGGRRDGRSHYGQHRPSGRGAFQTRPYGSRPATRGGPRQRSGQRPPRQFVSHW